MNEKIILDLLRELKPYEDISEETELIKSGILDSLAIFSLVTQLEEELEIEIAEEAITAESFATAKDIEDLVSRSKKQFEEG